MRKHAFKFVISLIGTITLICSVNVKNTVASVDIMAGGADILDPRSIYSAYAGYLDDIYVEDYAKKAEEDIVDIPGSIRDGVYIGDVNVSGLSYKQAMKAVDDYVEGLKTKTVTLDSINDEIVYEAGDLGIKWGNRDAAIDAISLGKGQNLIAQYKTICDLKKNPKKYDLKIDYDRDAITRIVDEEAERSNVRPTDAIVERVDGHFVIQSQGSSGVEINVAKSVSDISTALDTWDKNNEIRVKLSADITESNLDEEALSQMTDILGSYTTSFHTSSADRSGNVKTGCKHINGTLLYPGEQLSVYETVSPFTEENGYFMAGSYLNGMVVESLGGGICQVSSTLYNAVIRAELQVDERSPHSMVVTYVDLSSDAAIAGTYKDFKFTNNTEYPIYIEGFTTEEKKITFNIYGKDVRPNDRTIEFESVETSKTEPEGEKIIADPSQPVGFISTQSAHIGYTGELWKIIKEDGVEVDRVKLNKSTYHPSPRTATVGIGATDANVVAAMNAAIETGSIDYCKQTIAGLTAAAQAAAAIGQ